jgi:hypothetical protein
MSTPAIPAREDGPSRAPVQVTVSGRIRAIDFARGLAVVLMILSHGVNGLLPFERFTDWGMVPVHAVTKVASSLFVIVFGIALAVIYVPRTQAPGWTVRRNRLLWRGLVVLFWYKVLTVVELYDSHDRAAIVDTLLYRDFPSYVEILGFYALALLWIPWLLPLWARLPALLRWSSPLVMTLAWYGLSRHWDFWGVPQLQALVVEHPDYYTWGQLARGPLVLVGLLIGGMLLDARPSPARRRWLAAAIAGTGLVLLMGFVVWADGPLRPALEAIAKNAGKHPPELGFMLFSVGGAFVLLGLALAGGEALARWLRPVTVIGSDALMAFIFHIVVIFVVFRGWLGYLDTVDYMFALELTVALILATASWIALQQWAGRWFARRRRGAATGAD